MSHDEGHIQVDDARGTFLALTQRFLAFRRIVM
jgi:hypothetical protein